MSDTEDHSFDNITQEQLRDISGTYGLMVAQRKEEWENIRSSFHTFANRFGRQFGTRRGSSKVVTEYKDLMEQASELLDDQYDVNNLDDDQLGEEAADAAIYLHNSEPSAEELRRTLEGVIEEDQEWSDYAEQSVWDFY